MKTIKNIAEKYLVMLYMMVYLFTSVSNMFFMPKRNLAVYANKQTERFGRLNSTAKFVSLDDAGKSNVPLFQHAFKSITEKKRNSVKLFLSTIAIFSMLFGITLAASKNGWRKGVNTVYIPNQPPYLSFCSLRL